MGDGRSGLDACPATATRIKRRWRFAFRLATNRAHADREPDARTVGPHHGERPRHRRAEEVCCDLREIPVSGSVGITAGEQRPSIDFNAANQQSVTLPLKGGASDVSLLHTGTGAPWATVTVRAAVPLSEPMLRGFQYDRTISPRGAENSWEVECRDLVKVEITGRSDATYNWVVIHDPIPAGASIVRSDNDEQSGSSWITFSKKLYDSYRAYFEEVTPGTFGASYVMRLNTAGAYQLPNSRTEAMYAPEVFAEFPLATFVIEP